MNEGSDRVDVPYRWPRTLLLPPRPPMVVYLDLNHWISLAKAESGHPDGSAYAAALDACVRAAREGRAVFPLSGTIFIEIDKISSHRQRRTIRDVIELVSRFNVVTSRSVVAAHEIEAMFDALVGPSSDPVNAMQYLDWGVARAFGTNGELRILEDGGDVTTEARQDWADGPEAFDAMVASAQVDLQRSVLDGPSPEEEPELRATGWNPEAVVKIAEQRAAQELEQARRFDHDPHWRRGRIRDAISAREVAFEFIDTINRGLDDRGVAFADVFTGPQDVRPAFDALPSFDVSVSLKTELHRNGQHPWTMNDIHDIDALAATAPYADVVVTDKAMARRCNTTGLVDRLATIVISDLDALVEMLGRADQGRDPTSPCGS